MRRSLAHALAGLVALTAAAGAQTDSTRPAAAPPHAARPSVVRGLYVNRWAMLGGRINELVRLADRTEVNALVIDVKDDRGYLLYRSSVPLAHKIGADTVQPLPLSRLRAILDTLRSHDIHAIARIVVAKDPTLARAMTAWTVKRRATGAPWLDKAGNPWLDPHRREVWAYAADLAEEAVRLGFREVQLDYVRFPDEPGLLRAAAFPLAAGRSRDQVIREQLAFVRSRLAPLGVPLAIDVFGLTTSATNDMGIGQKWESFADRADVLMPMTYPSHYARGAYDIPLPNAQPYAVIDHALRDALARNRAVSGAGEIVPWYQDFTLGRPRYGAAQVRAQMQAGYDNGVRSWVLWNPGSRYTVAALRPAILTAEEESPVAARRATTVAPSDSVPPR